MGYLNMTDDGIIVDDFIDETEDKDGEGKE